MQTNLQAVRRAAGYRSARAFAEHLGISVNTYTAYEQGRVSLTAERLWEFADALGCTADELLGRTPPGEPVGVDPRQELLDADFAELSDTGRAAALGAVQGILQNERDRADAAAATA